MVFINIPICPAFLYDFQVEYIQKGCAVKFNTNPSAGCFNEIAKIPDKVKRGIAICEDLSKN